MNTNEKSTPRRFAVRGSYDVSRTTDENRRHWANTNGFDADTCNLLGVRTILRNRCRYVFANNPRVRGMILTLASHTVGIGPRLQMRLGDGKQARKLNDQLETSFRAWAKEVKLAKKLRIIRIARVISGEIFPMLVINPLLSHDVKLDIQLIEADQVSNFYPQINDPHDVDGVHFDEHGNPEHYRVLKFHPGAMFRSLNPSNYTDISARFCLHYFGQDRPGQHRGIPEITPAVQLVEEGRRFRAAVLGAAETAADFAMALETDAPADTEAAEKSVIGPMDTMELTRRIATVLPAGFRLTQTKAEQPTTTFKEFSRELLAESARCLQMPLSIATLDANDANMSSSYVVNQPYERAVETERFDMASDVLDPMLDMWLEMAFNPLGAAMAKRMPDEFPHAWFWPSIGNHADPAKVATAQEMKLKNYTTTLEREWAREGEDWEQGLRQRAKEIELQKELNLPDNAVLPTSKTSGDSNATPEDTTSAD